MQPFSWEAPTAWSAVEHSSLIHHLYTLSLTRATEWWHWELMYTLILGSQFTEWRMFRQTTTLTAFSVDLVQILSNSELAVRTLTRPFLPFTVSLSTPVLQIGWFTVFLWIISFLSSTCCHMDVCPCEWNRLILQFQFPVLCAWFQHCIEVWLCWSPHSTDGSLECGRQDNQSGTNRR